MRFSLERPVESETGTSVQQAAVGESGHLIKRTLAGARVDKIDYANRKAEKSVTLRLSRETSGKQDRDQRPAGCSGKIRTPDQVYSIGCWSYNIPKNPFFFFFLEI